MGKTLTSSAFKNKKRSAKDSKKRNDFYYLHYHTATNSPERRTAQYACAKAEIKARLVQFAVVLCLVLALFV